MKSEHEMSTLSSVHARKMSRLVRTSEWMAKRPDDGREHTNRKAHRAAQKKDYNNDPPERSHDE